MAKNSIILMDYSTIQKEAIAAEAIKPGHMIERDSDNKFELGDGVIALPGLVPMIAIEDELQGNTISDTYSIGDLVQARVLRAGDEVQARIATTQTLIIGDRLSINGAGQVIKAAVAATAADGDDVFAICRLAVTTPAADTLVDIEII